MNTLGDWPAKLSDFWLWQSKASMLSASEVRSLRLEESLLASLAQSLDYRLCSSHSTH